jgi:rhodanese-related sulfurtransferase
MTTARRTVPELALALVLLALFGTARAQDSFGGGAPGPQGPVQQPRPQTSAPTPSRPPQGPTVPAPLSPLSQMEREDLGVPPTNQLHAGAMHGPTPASIPGGQVITTQGLQSLISGRQTPFLLLDILGGPQVIPGAQPAVPASQPGSFNDAVQQQFGQYLAQATGGNKEMPLVLYCQSRECWMSYNAALRAINLGYSNVLWYRGGIEAWQAAGQPLQPAGMGAVPR